MPAFVIGSIAAALVLLAAIAVAVNICHHRRRSPSSRLTRRGLHALAGQELREFGASTAEPTYAPPEYKQFRV